MNAPDPTIRESKTFSQGGSPRLLHAAWLDRATLLLLLNAPGTEDASLDVDFGPPGETSRLEPLEFSAPGAGEFNRALLVGVQTPDDWPAGAALHLSGGGETAVLDAAAIKAQAAPIKTIVREYLAGLEPEDRHRFSHFLCTALARPSKSSRILHENLHVLRGALRERLPAGPPPHPSHPQLLVVEALLAIDEFSFYIEGWIRDVAPALRLTVVTPEGGRVEILNRAGRFARLDLRAFEDPVGEETGLSRPGFLAFFQLEAPSRLSTGWVVELENVEGDAIEADAPEPIRNLEAIRDRVLSDAMRDDSYDRSLIKDHIIPAIERIQARHAGRVTVERVVDFGFVPAAPEVSIIVPIYRRVDLIEQQFAQFAHDPALREAELIYVLDSPADRDWFLVAAGHCHELYGIAFRAVLMQRNGGFSAANNAAANLARGRLLLLLNSDVFPDAPGWLAKLVAFHDARPQLGAVGPKLLYEDDSIQHAGLYFTRPDERSPWNNEHYFKGFHRSLPAANVARPVPAVTAAALMIARDLYRELGGLRGIYVQGDFEDSDLCLRLWESGREVWYCPEVELYHLEGQSYPSVTRQLTGLCNRWLHTLHQGGQIVRVNREFSASVRIP